MLGASEKSLAALVEQVRDGLRDEIVLRVEVSVEGTVREPGFGHHAGNADPVGSYDTNGLGSLAQYSQARSLFVLVVVSHTASDPASGLANLHRGRAERLRLCVGASAQGRELTLDDVGCRANDGDGHGAIRVALLERRDLAAVVAEGDLRQPAALAAFHYQQLVLAEATHPVRARDGALETHLGNGSCLAVGLDRNAENLA